jgi:hypothetical protein
MRFHPERDFGSEPKDCCIRAAGFKSQIRNQKLRIALVH